MIKLPDGSTISITDAMSMRSRVDSILVAHRPNWELVYDLIFQNAPFDWFDPNKSYEQDVLSLIEFLDNCIGQK